MEVKHISQRATHRLKIGVVEDSWGKVALATIRFIEFHAVCHDLLIQPSRTIRRWRGDTGATLSAAL
jgi:hypothetical protein